MVIFLQRSISANVQSNILKPESIVEHFQLDGLRCYQPSFNITPAQKVLPIVELEDKSRKAVYLVWGLVPSWIKDRKSALT
jgi:putative SOS response-associated peptidase YedK